MRNFFLSLKLFSKPRLFWLDRCSAKHWLVFVFALMSICISGLSQAEHRPVPELALDRQLDSHDQLAVAKADPVDQQLARYARLMPEMGFLRLYGAGAANIIKQLPVLLGSGAINMDYEHNASQSDTLINLQMMRIGLMAENNFPSATLFKVGAGSAFDHSNLCIITLDVRPYRLNQFYASRFLAPSQEDQIFVLRKKILIENEKFLKFTVDHEVFHCIDAYFNGPSIKKTHDALYSHYQNYMSEARADAFASLVFMQSEENPEQFLELFSAMRTLSLLSLDFQHFTSDIVQHSINLSSSSRNRGLRYQLNVSRKLAADVAPSFAEYGMRLANTIRLVGAMGVDPNDLIVELEGRQLPKHNDSKVAALLVQVRKAKRILKLDVASSVRYKPCSTTTEIPGIEIN